MGGEGLAFQPLIPAFAGKRGEKKKAADANADGLKKIE